MEIAQVLPRQAGFTSVATSPARLRRGIVNMHFWRTGPDSRRFGGCQRFNASHTRSCNFDLPLCKFHSVSSAPRQNLNKSNRRMAGLNLLLALSFAAFCGISGLPAAPTTANPRLHCHVQKDLQYNTSNRPASNYNYPYDPLPLETLAEAICCDSYFSYFAEPVKFFAQPDVRLFESLNASTTTVFYDSACGIPLFRAPIGRSFETWRNESLTHGWPSFRTAEVFEGNVNITDNGEVVSKCGTHLGTNDPDALGTRYCLDLVCISGHGSNVMV